MATVLRSDAASTDPAAFVAAVREAVAAGQTLRLELGDQVCDLDGDFATAVLTLLEVLGEAEIVELSRLPKELTTGQAAEVLGVSRPTVVSLVNSGAIPATRIGSHRRLRAVDVLEYRERARQRREDAFSELVEISAELGLYDE